MSREPQKSGRGFFRRHRVLTLVLFVACVTLAMDVVAANLLKLLPRADLYELSDEEEYRIGSVIFHHTLKANYATDRALWGRQFYPMRTNSLGFKDGSVREVSIQRPVSDGEVQPTRRLLFIGDSFTEGLAYPFEQTFVGLISRELRGDDVEVLNAAVSSYSPSIYLARVNHLLETGFEFDELIVCIDLSDIEDDARFYGLDEASLRVKDTGEWDADARRRAPDRSSTEAAGQRRTVAGDQGGEPDSRGSSGVKGLIRDNTLLTYWLLSTLRDAVFGKPEPGLQSPVNNHRAAWTYDDATFLKYGKRGLQRATAHMDRLAGLLDRHGIRLTVVVYPWPDQVHRRQLDCRQVTHWRAWSAEHHARFLDLFPVFIDGRDPAVVLNECFIPWDVHWNEHGHERVARAFLDWYGERPQP